MTHNLEIAWKFLLAKKRAMAMSLAGISFGVGFFVVTQAQTSGFEEFFIQTILGTDGAIRVEDQFQDTIRSLEAGASTGSSFRVSGQENVGYVEGIADPASVIHALRPFRNVVAISEVVRGNVQVRSTLRDASGHIFGIRLEDHLGASDLGRQIVVGSLEEFRANPGGILIGRDLARRLQVGVGDTLLLATDEESRRFRIAAIYETGVREIDRSRLFVHLGEARSLLRRPHGASFLQINLQDRNRAPFDAERMADTVYHNVVSWQEREKVWLEVFRALRISSALTVSTIILISGLGMFNTLAMIVMEKTREISILRSMGYRRRDISHIFLWQGSLVLMAGTCLGWILGAAVTWGVSSLPIRIRGIFTTDSFVVNWSLSHYLWAAVTATVIVFIASYIPARRAARLEPGDVIRGTAQ